MVSSCAAINCKARFKKDENIKFHRFPKDVILKRKWISALHRKDFEPSPTTIICSQHFKKADYEPNSMGTLWLRKDAVPSVFDFSQYFYKKKNAGRHSIGRRKLMSSDIRPLSASAEFTKVEPEESGQDLIVPKEADEDLTSAEPTETNQGSSVVEPTETEQSSYANPMKVEDDPLEAGHDLSAAVSLEDDQESAVPKVAYKRRRRDPIFVGDFVEEDLECPIKRHRYWTLTQDCIKKQRDANRTVSKQNQRLRAKVTSLNAFLADWIKTDLTSKRLFGSL